MERKETLLEKMKKEKPFLETEGAKEEKAETKTPELQKTEQEINYLFSAPATLFRKSGDSWDKVSTGKILGKEIEKKGVQLLFALENTRVVLNTLIATKGSIKQNGRHLLFTVAEEKEAYIACVAMKTEQEAKEVSERIEEKLC